MNFIPLWALLPISLAGSLVAAELGFLAGRFWRRRTGLESKEGVGLMVGGALGLLAFLLAFQTSVGVGRFDTRRQLVVQEANAIATTNLRAGYLDEPYRTQIRGLLRQYVDERLLIGDPARRADATAVSVQIHDTLWPQAEALARANPQSLPASWQWPERRSRG